MKPFSQCNKSDIIKYIKKYFGTIIIFNRMTGRNYAAIYSWRNKKVSRELMMDVYADIIEYKGKVGFNEVTDKLKDQIRFNIYSEYKNVREFCKKHPEFSEQWISNFLNGHYRRVQKRAKLLIKVLNIKKDLLN